MDRSSALLDKFGFASGITCFAARLGFGIGHAARNDRATVDNHFPIPTTVATTAGHNAKFDSWLRAVHGHSSDFMFGGCR
jgi:hypothetical protein